MKNIISEPPLVTIFMPCLNEEQNVAPSLDTVARTMREVGYSCEILIFDDHSTDKTIERINEYCICHPEIAIRLVRNKRILGLGYNYVEGAYQGRGTYYMLINSDNSEPVSSLVAILSQLDKADMIIPYLGKRDSRRRRRRLVSSLFTWLINLLNHQSIRYYNGPVLHLRYNVMRWHPDSHGFAYQAELISRLLGFGMTYKEVQISNIDRISGTTKAFTLDNLLSILHSMFQILVRRLKNVIERKSS